ncbi:MAG: hypothetical protein JSR66_00120 [Proteobacteria bacterium]|nr:hypothetical protein [Pseudomonadota bacterium]
MFKTILLPVVSTGVETSSFGAAVALARMFVGHIDLLYARPEAATAAAAYGGKVTARWHREIGKVADCIAGCGRASDIAVVARGGDPLRSQTIRGALFESGKPVLIPGLRPPSLETILVAWKPTREAARSVGAALPFLAQAKRVVVAGVSEDRSVTSNDRRMLAIKM